MVVKAESFAFSHVRPSGTLPGQTLSPLPHSTAGSKAVHSSKLLIAEAGHRCASYLVWWGCGSPQAWQEPFSAVAESMLTRRSLIIWGIACQGAFGLSQARPWRGPSEGLMLSIAWSPVGHVRHIRADIRAPQRYPG